MGASIEVHHRAQGGGVVNTDDIITQINLALGKGYRLAAVIGALTGGGVTYCTHAMARGDLATTPWVSGHYAWFLGRLALVIGGLLFSIVTTYGFGRSAFGSGWLAVGFLVIMDGVMVASSQPSLEWFATGLLIAIEAVTTGCTVARGRMATLAKQKPTYRVTRVTAVARPTSKPTLKAVA